MEVNARAYVTLKLTASWLAMRLDMLSILIIAGTGVWGGGMSMLLVHIVRGGVCIYTPIQ